MTPPSAITRKELYRQIPNPARVHLPVRTPLATYVVAGYSQAARFDGIIVEERDGPIVMKARWQPMLRAAAFFENGKVSEWLTRILLEMRQLRRMDAPIETPFPALVELGDPAGRPYYYVPRDPERLVLLFYAGEPDWMDVAGVLHPRYDFDLDPTTPGLDVVPWDSEWVEKIPVERVRGMMREKVRPLFDAMLTLRQSGYRNVFFHDLPPPPLQGKANWKPYRLRFKLTALTNELYSEFARSSGIGFIRIWDSVTNNGARDMRFDEDGVHLNRAAAALSIEQLQQLIAAEACG